MLQEQIEVVQQLFNGNQYAKALEISHQLLPLLEAEENWEAYIDMLILECECNWRTGANAIALETAEKALSTSLKQLGENDLHTANCYHHIGAALLNLGDYDKAIGFFKTSLNIRQNKLGEHHYETTHSYNNLGVCYVEKGYLDKAISHFETCLDIRLKHFGNLHPLVASGYNNLGICFHKKGDYDLGVRYMERALNIRLTLNGEQHLLTAMSYNNMGVCYESMKNFDESVLYYKKSLKIRKKAFDSRHPEIAMNYNNVGICHEKKGDFDKAIYFHKRALSILLFAFGENHPLVAECYNNLGACYEGKNNYKKAIEYFERSLKIRLQVLGEKHSDTAVSYLNLGLCLNKLGKDPLQCFHQAMNCLFSDYSDPDPFHNPTIRDYSNAPVLLDALVRKAEAHFDIFKTNNLKPILHLLAAYHTFHHAIQLIDQMRGSYQAEGSKLILSEKAKNIYDQAINVNWQVNLFWNDLQMKPPLESAFFRLKQIHPDLELPHPNEALNYIFVYAEKCKAVLLFAAIKERHAQQTAGIPLHLKEEEQRLRVEINFLEKRIAETQYEKEDDKNIPVLMEWKSSLFDFKQHYASLLKSFEADYPDYFQLKYQTQTVTAQQIRLPARTALLEFFVGETYIYICLFVSSDILTPDNNAFCHQTVFQIDKPPKFEALIAAFVRNIENYNNRNYVHQGYVLYQILLQNALEKLPPNSTDTLVIIPDGILTKLPFEALLTHPVAAKGSFDYPYLLMKFDIQYHFSATLWHYYRTRPLVENLSHPSNNANFIGFAPVYTDKQSHNDDKRTGNPVENLHALSDLSNKSIKYRSIKIGDKEFDSLPESENELLGIQSIFLQNRLTATLFMHEQATISNFLAEAGNYHFVHIAAHSDYNDQFPDLTGILFSPESNMEKPVLYLNDIFQLQLKAGLLVLSCCETGLGKQNEGEGMMALNRGFLYAGAHNIIYTLFKVLDNPTSQLAQILYKYILEGFPYPKALKMAKSDMVYRQYPPSYWSGFVLMGR